MDSIASRSRQIMNRTQRRSIPRWHCLVSVPLQQFLPFNHSAASWTCARPARHHDHRTHTSRGGLECRVVWGALSVNLMWQAIEKAQPRLFWLSASHIESLSDSPRQYQLLYQSASDCGTAIVVGGNIPPTRRRAAGLLDIW